MHGLANKMFGKGIYWSPVSLGEELACTDNLDSCVYHFFGGFTSWEASCSRYNGHAGRFCYVLGADLARNNGI